MARIKIEDLPVKEEMSEQELKGVFGGMGLLLPAVQKVRAAAHAPSNSPGVGRLRSRSTSSLGNFDMQDIMSKFNQSAQ